MLNSDSASRSWIWRCSSISRSIFTMSTDGSRAARSITCRSEDGACSLRVATALARRRGAASTTAVAGAFTFGPLVVGLGLGVALGLLGLVLGAQVDVAAVLVLAAAGVGVHAARAAQLRWQTHFTLLRFKPQSGVQ